MHEAEVYQIEGRELTNNHLNLSDHVDPHVTLVHRLPQAVQSIPLTSSSG
jgi:hypothetical protein